MIRRFYVHNFRCLENFELRLAKQPSWLLIGKNGTGKTTVARGLAILQRIARGTSRVRDLVTNTDLAMGRSSVPMTIEIEMELQGHTYQYDLALELPAGFHELRVAREKLTVDGKVRFTRTQADVSFPKGEGDDQGRFRLDWHVVALPVLQQQSTDDPVGVVKGWLARMIILRPVPSRIGGDSRGDGSLEPEVDVTNLAEWFSGIIKQFPSAYQNIASYLKRVMPDFQELQNRKVAADAFRLFVQYASTDTTLSLPLSELSDGEKIFVLCAVIMAANKAYGPVACFWDEPDAHVTVSELAQFVTELRTIFAKSGSQLIATSHNIETIRQSSVARAAAL